MDTLLTRHSVMTKVGERCADECAPKIGCLLCVLKPPLQFQERPIPTQLQPVLRMPLNSFRGPFHQMQLERVAALRRRILQTQVIHLPMDEHKIPLFAFKRHKPSIPRSLVFRHARRQCTLPWSWTLSHVVSEFVKNHLRRIYIAVFLVKMLRVALKMSTDGLSVRAWPCPYAPIV